MFETPLHIPSIYNFGKENELKSNFKTSTEKLKNKYKNKICDFYANIFKSSNINENKINNNIMQMNKEEIKKITEENIIKEQKNKIIKKEGTGQCLPMLIYLFSLISLLFILKKYYDRTQLNMEKYESVRDFNSELLDKIKNYEDIEKLDDKTIDYLSLRLFHFADLPYYFRNNGKEKIFLERFKDWEIFGGNKIGKDNCFYIFKNTKNKKIIVSFPGTILKSTQLFEEFLGSSLKNFHINNKNILISQYFGERISELLNFIFTPKVNELLDNNYQIISTGHSLGGAIAQAFIYFAIVENKINKYNCPMTITFNQPKVGNKLFAEFLNEKAVNLRFTKGNDIVSSIPFSNFGFFDMLKYIFNKRNIYNEYVHTRGDINISDNDSWNLPAFIKVIFLILMLYGILLFFNGLFDLLSNLQNTSKILDIFLYVSYIISLIIYAYFINIIFFNIVYKYGTYKFFVLFLLFSSFIMELIFLIFVLIVVLFYEIYIFINNFCLKIVNLNVTQFC